MDSLLKLVNQAGFDLDFPRLETIVFDNDKQRFAFNEDQTKIRANQGHSVVIYRYRPLSYQKYCIMGRQAIFDHYSTARFG